MSKPLDVRPNIASQSMVERNAKRLSENNMHALAFVAKNPGCTAGEYNKALGHDMNNVILASRPLDWLRRHGHIRAGEIRKCSAKGTPMTTWHFVSLQGNKQIKRKKHHDAIVALESGMNVAFAPAIAFLKCLG